MKSFSDKIKSVIIVGVVLLLGVASAIRLMKIQIVGDEEIVADTTNNDNDFVYTKSTKATRGEIVDYSDNLIVGNNTSTNIVLQKALFPEDNDKGNAILLKVYNELKSHGYTVEQNLPISETSPYVFTDGDTAALISDLNLNVYATAEDCMAKLIDDYDISDDYSESEKRPL
jgi:penicillin-binding protein 2